jgi:hypothetical protein
MYDLLFHNVYLRGIGILLLVETIFLVQTIRNRKPGASVYAACFVANSLTERGLRAKRRCDVVSGVIVVWFIVAVLTAVTASG